MGLPRLPATMLVDLPNWVGDQMMAMPALNRLVEGNGGGETVLHTRPPMARFLSSVFPQTRVIASPRKFSPFFSARELREGGWRFEIGITLRNAARGKILIRLSARFCPRPSGSIAAAIRSMMPTRSSQRSDSKRRTLHGGPNYLTASRVRVRRR